MSPVLRGLPALGAVFFVLVGVSACGGGGGAGSGNVASVNGKAISKPTYVHWLTVAWDSSQPNLPGKPKAPVPSPPDYASCVAQLKATQPKPATGQPKPSDAQLKTQCKSEYQSLQSQVLQFLISADWVFGEASDQGLSVTDKQVNQQFNQIKASQFPKPAQFQAFLAQSGQNTSDLLLRVKLDLLSTKLRNKITKGTTTVTPAQVSAYYNSHKSSFAQPERRDLRLILTKTKAQAQSARKQIQSGQKFAAVAKKSSIDAASKAQGGAVLGVIRGQEEKTLDAAVFGAKRGVLSGPVQTPFGFYVFQVQKVTPSTQQTLAQATPLIKQQLTTTQSQSTLQKFVTGFRKKWTARTSCASGYVVQDCKQFKPPKSATGLPGAPTTVTTGGR